MLQRRRIHTSAPLRSSLADAAFAVEERVVWGGTDVLRGIVDVVKWPFERAIWAIEKGLVWPLEERTGRWNVPLRGIGVASLALVAVAAGVLGLVWAAGSGGGNAQQTQQASAPVVAPVPAQAKEELAQAAPVLQGAPPDLTPKVSASATKAGDAAAAKASEEGAGASTAATTDKVSSSPDSASTSAEVAPAGPAATKVARQFAGGFVLYETGRSDAKVRAAFAATATPELARSLLHRPPRLPANVKVPRAKVLNVVPGPIHGDTYTLSASLLRLGVTSELRVDVQRNPKSGEWQVTDVRG
jgi:hypothetical protein